MLKLKLNSYLRVVYKGTYLKPIDSSGVWLVRIFHLYRGGFRKVSSVGCFIKCSVRSTKPNNLVKKKSKLKGIIIHTSKEVSKKDGSSFRFKVNTTVLLKKRMTPKGKELIGPVLYNIKRKRFISSFSGII